MKPNINILAIAVCFLCLAGNAYATETTSEGNSEALVILNFAFASIVFLLLLKAIRTHFEAEKRKEYRFYRRLKTV